jgi:hypothetical protein
MTLRELLLATAVAGLAIAWWQDHRTRQAENDDLSATVYFEMLSDAFCVNFEERAAMERDYHDRTGRWPAEIAVVIGRTGINARATASARCVAEAAQLQ